MEEQIASKNGIRNSDAGAVHQWGSTVNGFREKVVSEKLPDNADIQGLRERMQKITAEVMEHLEKQQTVKSEKIKEVEQIKENDKNWDKYREERKFSKEGALPEKEFCKRNSLLTDLYEISHFRALYNIFIVSLIVLALNTITYDIINTGTTNVGFTVIRTGFHKFSTGIGIWLLMFGSTLTLYGAFNVWAQQRLKLFPKSLSIKIWDYGCLTLLIVYQIMFLRLPPRMVLEEELGIATSTAVLMEQVRMVMKTHAFVRSSAPRFLSYKPHTEMKKPIGPDFSQFLYFMFAPTLIYRDSYPRTQRIRWKVVAWNYGEVVMSIFYVAFLFERFIWPNIEQTVTFPLSFQSIVICVFKEMLASTMFVLCAFYCLLHAWMNGSAELMQFADRLFYKDWWNTTSYAGYYRTWNIVVHDWLYTYIYKDMYENVTRGNKGLSTYLVFTASALCHEYIIAFTLRFFYPVLLLMFGGIGFTLFLLRRYSGNIFLLLTLCIGNSLLVTFYSIETYARMKCDASSSLDFFIPRSWYCTELET